MTVSRSIHIWTPRGKRVVGGGGGGGMNWEIGTDIYTPICIKWITNKSLLYKNNKIKFKSINKNKIKKQKKDTNLKG